MLIIPELDKLHEECGVFGVYAPGQDVARITFFGLYVLQHRGQDRAPASPPLMGHVCACARIWASSRRHSARPI